MWTQAALFISKNYWRLKGKVDYVVCDCSRGKLIDVGKLNVLWPPIEIEPCQLTKDNGQRQFILILSVIVSTDSDEAGNITESHFKWTEELFAKIIVFKLKFLVDTLYYSPLLNNSYREMNQRAPKEEEVIGVGIPPFGHKNG